MAKTFPPGQRFFIQSAECCFLLLLYSDASTMLTLKNLLKLVLHSTETFRQVTFLFKTLWY